MRRANRTGVRLTGGRRVLTPTNFCAWLCAAVMALLVGCGDETGSQQTVVPDHPGAVKTAALVRAQRRAYDGAPPVIGHVNFNIQCTQCHNERGMALGEIGFAPPMPHENTAGLSAVSNCTQCHVFQQTQEVFAVSTFAGLAQDLRHGQRLNEFAPPVLPHPVFMRENCFACHSGPAAREEIRSDHPDRLNCTQCHVPVYTDADFAR